LRCYHGYARILVNSTRRITPRTVPFATAIHSTHIPDVSTARLPFHTTRAGSATRQYTLRCRACHAATDRRTRTLPTACSPFAAVHILDSAFCWFCWFGKTYLPPGAYLRLHNAAAYYAHLCYLPTTRAAFPTTDYSLYLAATDALPATYYARCHSSRTGAFSTCNAVSARA